MKKLKKYYKILLEAEKVDIPTIIPTPKEDPPDMRGPNWERRFKPNYIPQVPDSDGTTRPNWDNWNGDGPPPQNWPRFPNGVPYPPNPPLGWPPIIDDNGRYNPNGIWPPVPGHPIYSILDEFMRSNPNWFNLEPGATIPWLDLPLSVQTRLFDEFRIRIWDMRNNDFDPPDLEWIRSLGLAILTGGISTGLRIGLIRDIAWREFLYGLGILAGETIGWANIEDVARELLDIDYNDPVSPEDNPVDNPPEPFPWGTQWPPPQGWYFNPYNGQWFNVPMPELPEGADPAGLRYVVGKGPPPYGYWKYKLTGNEGGGLFLFNKPLIWNPFAMPPRWVPIGSPLMGDDNSIVNPTVFPPGLENIPDNPRPGGYRLRQDY